MLNTIFFALLIVATFATSASAQSFVAASIGADLVKSYQSETDGQSYPDGESEALSWGLRFGTSLGSRWGVELEFNRPEETETSSSGIYPLTASGLTIADLGLAIPGLTQYTPRVETSQRNTVWNALAWVTHPIGGRADLAFMAGIGFARVTQTTEFNTGSIAIPAGALYPSILPIPRTFRTTTISYGVGPVVGAEARIRMTDHLDLVPGFRVQSLGSTIMPAIVLRPSVALSWTF
jgi:hypothetical protein